MRPLRKTSLVTLLLVSSSFQFEHFIAARSPQAAQESRLVAAAPGAVPQSPQAPPAQQRQEPSAEKAQATEQKQPDYSQEAYVIERMTTSYRFEKDGAGRREQSFRVKVQSDAGVETFGQLVFPYSSANEKLDIEQVSVRKSDGKVVTASASAVQDLTAPISREAPVYTDLRQKHVTVPGLRPGDTLEYRVVWRIITPLAPNHFWLEHEFLKRNWIVLDERLEVDIPQGSVAQLKTETGLDPVVKEQDGRRVYSWKHANLKREDEDKDDEKKEEKKDEKKKEEFDGPKPPQIQMTTFKSWEEVGQWYASIQRDRIKPDDKIRAKVVEQAQGLNGDLEKVEALYNFVSKNFRYVSLSFGQGRYQPHAATEVFANQYGDCKDKHTLLASMLAATGIQASPALINSERKLDPDVPSPAQFDHVITAIQLGKETLWVDTTPEVAPFRLLSPTLRKKQALLIPENAPARLETTPADPPFLNKVTVEIEGKVNDLGELSGRSHSTLRGDPELFMRTMFRSTPKADWKRLGVYLTYDSGWGTEVTDVRPGDPGATEKPFEVEYDFTRAGFLDWSSKKVMLSLPLPSISLPYPNPDKREDSKPIELGSPFEITYRLKLSLPARYRIRAPVPVTVTRDYAEYRSSYKLEGTTLVAERSLRVGQGEIPAARMQDYVAFLTSAQADGSQKVSVETDVAGAPSIPDSMKVEDLLKTASAAAENGNYAMAEELLKRALTKEPKHKYARRLLGFALFEQRKYDAAVEVLREQTRINPFDDYCYDLMGRVFWAQQKYQESEAAFRKQIEVTPLDKEAQGNLGQMLVEWRKYKEAAPELERAIALNPDEEPQYQISLGRVYINLSQMEKASEALDRAIKLEPGPLVWNNVAYILALGNLQLEKAQQYAESAVTEVATKLRNVELERMTLEDLANVGSLTSYWDTLGWVHFKKGNLDLAEKYLMASWKIAHHSEVGDHLGQFIEKRGNKEEAIRWYALAAVGLHPVPEARENLTRLAGKDKVDSLLDKAKAELAELRAIKLGSLLKDEREKLEAEFYIIAVPGAERIAQVTGARFIRGAEKLRPLAAALKGVKYAMIFPDETATKLIRRGTLTCQPQNGECSFALLPPEEITSID
jgi:tetratricopeptide (TPR) repeat protein/transglutaminase-like putative cysteine protease